MKIAVDPGHGMSNRVTDVYDSGAVGTLDGKSYEEADIALGYGLALKDAIIAAGHSAFLTRASHDDPAPLGLRAKRAEQAGCDIFVSLHLNQFDDPKANGLEVLYRDDEDLALARIMSDALVRATGLRPRGPKQRTDLAVLKFVGPAILIELGFISHRWDLEELLDPQVRDNVVTTITEQIVTLFAKQAESPDKPAPKNAIPLYRAAPAFHLPTYRLPDYADAKFGLATKIPWAAGKTISALNFLSGLVEDSFTVFPNDMIVFESKFAIDNDGIGGNEGGDPAHQSDTSVHDMDDRPLHAGQLPFVVLPLPHKKPSIPQLTDLGLGLGDFGICYWKNGTACPVIVGDLGPAHKLGEGSVKAAQILGIDPDPNVGGIDATEVPPGVLMVLFPKSAKVKKGKSGRPCLTIDAADIPTEVEKLVAAHFA